MEEEESENGRMRRYSQGVRMPEGRSECMVEGGS